MVTEPPRKYRKRPVVIEAIQFTGENHHEIVSWVGGPGPYFGKAAMVDRAGDVLIHTLEGNHRARPGDFVIRGVQGEFYPCKPDIFEATYEPAPPDDEELQ
jgi:hypothetical protein